MASKTISGYRVVAAIGIGMGLLLTLTVFSHVSFAAGGVGSGGSGSGGGGGSWGYTRNGHGWAEYDINGSGPTRGFREGAWSTVQSTCRGSNASTAMVYILGTGRSAGNHDGNYMGYSFQAEWATYQNFWNVNGGRVDNNRANRVAVATAKNRFDALRSYGVNTSGYRWGANVGWFCWSFGPRWTMTATTTVNRSIIRPGDTATWTHNARNNGPQSTAGSRLGVKKTQTWRSSTNDPFRTETNISPPGSTTRSIGSGQNLINDTSTYRADEGENGWRICRRTIVSPVSNIDPRENPSTFGCVDVRNQWGIRVPNGSISQTTASVGDTVTWQHTAHGITKSEYSGYGDNTTQRINYEVLQYRNNNTQDIRSVEGASGSRASGWRAGVSNGVSLGSSYTIRNEDAGSTICRYMRTSAAAWNRTSEPLRSSPLCVVVPAAPYELIPSIQTDPSRSVEPGSDVRVEPSVSNGDRSASAQTRWQVHKIVYRPGNQPMIEIGNPGTQEACAYYRERDRTDDESCEILRNEDGQIFPANRTLDLRVLTETVGENLPLGTQICFGLSINPYGSGSARATWRHSNLACVIIGKKPKLQVVGGDTRVGGLGQPGWIQTSISPGATDRDGTVGSWGEYGVLSKGTNTNFASGSGLNKSTAGSLQTEWSKLTFANADSRFGTWGAMSLQNSEISSYFANKPSSNRGGAIDPGTLESGVYRGGNMIVNSTSDISQGKTIVLNSTGKVTINGNIRYETTGLSASSLPQVVIIADNIEIAQGVEVVDAWLISRKWLNTCTEGSRTTIPSDAQNGSNYAQGRLSAGICNDKVTINGATSIADKLYLYRTAGDGRSVEDDDVDGRGDEQYAEVFNLRADAYVWGYEYERRTNTSGAMQTVSARELPPRF